MLRDTTEARLSSARVGRVFKRSDGHERQKGPEGNTDGHRDGCSQRLFMVNATDDTYKSTLPILAPANEVTASGETRSGFRPTVRNMVLFINASTLSVGFG